MRGLILAGVFFGFLPFIFSKGTFHGIIKGPFFGVLMWFWVSLMNPQQIVWSSVFAAVPYALIVGVATLLSMLITRSEPKLPPAGKTTVLLVLLMLWISVTSLTGIGPPAGIFVEWDNCEKMLLMTIVAYTLTNSQARLDQLIIVCVLSIAFYGFKGGLITILSGGASRVQGPNNSMIVDNNNLGVALTMTLPLIFYLHERYRQRIIKWPMHILIGLTILGDIFTYSRGALIAITAMGTSLWIRSRKKTQILVLIVIAAVGMWNFAPEKWTDRMFSIEHYQKDPSAEGRLWMWRRAWELAKHKPLVGGGFHWAYDPNTVNRLFLNTDIPPLESPLAPHSIWFEMLGNHGFIGLALFILVIVSAFVDAHWLMRNARDPDLLWANNLGRMLQVALIGYCAGGTFVTLAMYDAFYAIVIIAAVARRVVAAELASRKVVARAGRDFAAAARPGPALRPQPSG